MMPLHETLQLSTLHPTGRAFVVNTSSRADAKTLVDVLNGVSVSSLGLDSTDTEHKKRRIKSCLLTEVTDQRHRKKRCRLIVRNLAFQATEDMIKEKLDVFGPIAEVDVPKVRVKVRGDDGEYERLNPRGFGFVTFLCEKDAKNAVSSSLLEGDSSGGKGVKICNRLVAIDFCVPKDRFVQNDGSLNDESSNQAMEIEGEGEKDEGELGEADESLEDADLDEDAEERDDEEDAGDQDASETAEVTGKRSAPGSDVDEGCTVFVRCTISASNHSSDSHHIRDLSTDTSPADLKRAFGRFGAISLAVTVKGEVQTFECIQNIHSSHQIRNLECAEDPRSSSLQILRQLKLA